MTPLPITEDYYKILEVEQTASPELIVSSYRRLARQLHPDRNAKEDATEAFQQVRYSSGHPIKTLSVLTIEKRPDEPTRH
jgi:preprotein translocase subunit Sec63